jgi:spermidine synthase
VATFRSRFVGAVRVVETARERRLVAGGEILSVYPLDGDWTRVQREYWGQALALGPLPPRPEVLLVGLGGGTQVHLVHQLARPRRLAVIERDPAILRAALRWFALDTLTGVEFLCAEARWAVAWLAAVRHRFDLVVEDAAYADTPEPALELARALVPLVRAGGGLVLNRHRRGDAWRTARALRALFRHVRVRLVRREAENALVVCRGPRRSARRA